SGWHLNTWVLMGSALSVLTVRLQHLRVALAMVATSGFNTSSLVAILNENSDICADSVNARGGNVTINTSSLFGIELSDRNTSLSDITATGASSELSGTVEINVQDVDPTRGLAQLPTEVVDASRLVAIGCSADQGSSFVII
ncbi:MAG TPA: hypothetical protein V6C90_23450, partial [Coleofasciculaceae cyanobacterium]